MKKPAIVVKAAPTMAEPVEERISVMLSLLLSDFLNLSIIWIEYVIPKPIVRDVTIIVITFRE